MLPESAREELRKAANTPTDRDPLARVKAIDRAMDKLKFKYPEHFKSEAEDEDNSPDQ